MCMTEHTINISALFTDCRRGQKLGNQVKLRGGRSFCILTTPFVVENIRRFQKVPSGIFMCMCMLGWGSVQ